MPEVVMSTQPNQELAANFANEHESKNEVIRVFRVDSRLTGFDLHSASEIRSWFFALADC
jgi:hypothetical protein